MNLLIGGPEQQETFDKLKKNYSLPPPY